MRRRIIPITLALLLAGGAVVSAAGVWGQYKGHDIIRLTLGGQTIDPGDVPAILYQGRTMIPVYLLGKIGVAYTWDQKTKTVHFEDKESQYAAAAYVAEGYAETARHARTMAEQLKNRLLEKQLRGEAPPLSDYASELRKLIDDANETLVARSAMMSDTDYETFLVHNASAYGVLAEIEEAQKDTAAAAAMSPDDPDYADKTLEAERSIARAVSKASELETKTRGIYLQQMKAIIR